jgi:hypothetical protein
MSMTGALGVKGGRAPFDDARRGAHPALGQLLSVQIAQEPGQQVQLPTRSGAKDARQGQTQGMDGMIIAQLIQIQLDLLGSLQY